MARALVHLCPNHSLTQTIYRMKIFKSLTLSAALSLSAFGGLFLTSCNQDECKDVVCQNGGTCNEDDGSCACPTGYEGDLCQTLSRDKFIGTYSGTEQCSQGNDAYTITIATNSDQLRLTLTNLYNQNFTAIATVTGTNTFSFTGSQASTNFNGTGTLTNNQLSVTYTISIGTLSNTCTFTGTK